MKKYILLVILISGLAFGSNQLMAQPGFDDEVVDTPLDGGIGLLLGAAIVFGIKNTKSKRNKLTLIIKG